MKATVGFGICAELAAFRICLPRILQICLQTFGVIVGIDEIIARVIGRVDVNHLDFAKV
jgi:hypothetical protein